MNCASASGQAWPSTRDFTLLDLIRRKDEKGLRIVSCSLGDQWEPTVEALLATDLLILEGLGNVTLSPKGAQLMAAISHPIYKN